MRFAVLNLKQNPITTQTFVMLFHEISAEELQTIYKTHCKGLRQRRSPLHYTIITISQFRKNATTEHAHLCKVDSIVYGLNCIVPSCTHTQSPHWSLSSSRSIMQPRISACMPTSPMPQKESLENLMRSLSAGEMFGFDVIICMSCLYRSLCLSTAQNFAATSLFKDPWPAVDAIDGKRPEMTKLFQ